MLPLKRGVQTRNRGGRTNVHLRKCLGTFGLLLPCSMNTHDAELVVTGLYDTSADYMDVLYSFDHQHRIR